MAASAPKSVDDIKKEVMKLNLLPFRKFDDVKKLAGHFVVIMNHPFTQESPKVWFYLKNLDQMHKAAYTSKRDHVEVEYIFSPETKSNLQRQRFNSLPISEVSELLKSEFPSTENADQVHICNDCDVVIDLDDEVPLMESLQKHFSLDVHLPKLKRESIDVAEPIVLPNMSRRLSAMACSDTPQTEVLLQQMKPAEKIDRMFLAKLDVYLIKYFFPDTSESTINNAVKFYRQAFDKLNEEIAGVDFSPLTGSVAPIIMSIKDNVNQTFAIDANRNIENDDNEQVSCDKPTKSPHKKNRYYGPIENMIIRLLTDHKLLSLTDDRTGKPAFFCIPCEYYSLRFRYDSVLNHVFSETHLDNLSFVLQADSHIPFVFEERSVDKIKEVNQKFLMYNSIDENGDGSTCGLCRITLDTPESSIQHVLDENHLCKMSDKLFRKFRAAKPMAQIPEDWGQKNLDWGKYLATAGKTLANKDPVMIENFIKPSGKIINYCPSCDTTLKGPRQILFNHVRQKKHLRNSAPMKLAMLYRNYCRPLEYYAGFGNFYLCGLCPNYVAYPSLAGIIEHMESDMHMETIAKFIHMAFQTENYLDMDLLSMNKIVVTDEMKCEICDVTFQDMHDAVQHVLSSIKHQNLIVDAKNISNKCDIICIYMKGNYVLHSEGSDYQCVPCKGVFNSLRGLLTHLTYAEHFPEKLSFESVFRFYLELKHNVNLLARNKYVYKEFGRLRCGVCDMDIEEWENAKKHVANIRHREHMGINYINMISLDNSGVE